MGRAGGGGGGGGGRSDDGSDASVTCLLMCWNSHMT